MSHDPGARELRALLETPSVPLEAAIEALGTSLEAAHGAEAGGAALPAGARAPISRLHDYFRELNRHVASIETGNPGRSGAMKALRRMEGALDNLAAAVAMEGEEAKQEAELGAVGMERASSELQRAVERLG
ncbi:MAG TPA: hypothetical protein VHA76_07745 [Solirubrobacterales bacterium]|nr:hypothetical protein [Solirubrobacterales bacterium]